MLIRRGPKHTAGYALLNHMASHLQLLKRGVNVFGGTGTALSRNLGSCCIPCRPFWSGPLVEDLLHAPYHQLGEVGFASLLYALNTQNRLA